MLRLLLLFCALVFSSSIDAKGPSQHRGTRYRHQLAVCAIFRDEARFLKEWIEFYRLMGVNRFYLYNNLSSDDYASVLAPYIASRVVDLVDWPFQSDSVAGWTKIQSDAYKDGLKKAVDEKVKWLAIVDTDEFLYPVSANSLVSFLRPFEDSTAIGGVVAHWQLFGTSGIKRIEEGSLMIELLVKKAPDGYGENGFVKSVVRPERVATIDDPHCVRYLPPYFAVNENYDRVPGSISPIVVSQWRINHYWSRDEDFFWETKVARRSGWQEGLDGQLRRLENINSIEDRTIQRFVEPLRMMIKGIRAPFVM